MDPYTAPLSPAPIGKGAGAAGTSLVREIGSLELPAEDGWWCVVELHASDASSAYYERGARQLWRRHRAELQDASRRLHGSRPHPFDLDPPGWPPSAEESLRERLDERSSCRRRHSLNGTEERI